MDSEEGGTWFMGDLSDPWVVAIAEAMPASLGSIRVDCAGELPARPFGPSHCPRLIVLHRHRLTAGDAARLRVWREPASPASPPALILCVSPYVRFEELERWSGLASLVLSEATAPDVLPRHVARLLEEPRSRPARGEGPIFRIEVACASDDLCGALVEACTRAGHPVEQVDDRNVGELWAPRYPSASPPERVLTIWEVPVLEPRWPERLERRSLATGPVIALVSFADRMLVARAKALGAVACLELPCNVDDLLDVIDRHARSMSEEAWPVPGRLEPPHVLPPRPRRRSRTQETPTGTPPWSVPQRRPTIR
ncbi:MAG: hypothetical protein ACHRXM_06810 [Isosphaerales bacterium]